VNIAYLSALSALAGSVFGGLTTGITTWLSLRSQARVGHRSGQLVRRQDLFDEFIGAASKAYGEALFNTESKIQDLNRSIRSLYTLCQSNASFVLARNRRARREGHNRNYRHLLHAEQDSPRR
jgi:hypothetical protein